MCTEIEISIDLFWLHGTRCVCRRNCKEFSLAFVEAARRWNIDNKTIKNEFFTSMPGWLSGGTFFLFRHEIDERKLLICMATTSFLFHPRPSANMKPALASFMQFSVYYMLNMWWGLAWNTHTNYNEHTSPRHARQRLKIIVIFRPKQSSFYHNFTITYYYGESSSILDCYESFSSTFILQFSSSTLFIW